jgi:CO/xanthine dehydrogenase Mo-binding subunit
MCCVQDVGMAINPDQLEAQIEGNPTWGLGMALTEKVEIGRSEIISLNFDRYSLPRIGDVPAFADEPLEPGGSLLLLGSWPSIARLQGDTRGCSKRIDGSSAYRA